MKNNVKKVAATVFSALAMVAAPLPAANALIGTYNAPSNGTTNSVGYFEMYNGSSHSRSMCTATAIDTFWAITAKHCVKEKASHGILGATISFGVDRRFPNFEVDSLYLHPKADLALIRTKYPTLARSAMSNSLPSVGMQGKAYGWGGGNGRVLNNLSMADVSVNGYKDNYLGIKRVGTNPNYSGTFYVPGDSGGPLFINGMLQGVLSTGTIDKQNPRVYAQAWYVPVANYAGWITETMRENPSPNQNEFYNQLIRAISS